MHLKAEQVNSLLRLDLCQSGWCEVTEDVPLSRLTPSQAAMTSLSRSLLKKFHNDETDDERDLKALSLFLECNTRCENFHFACPDVPLYRRIFADMKSCLEVFFNPAPGSVAVAKIDDFTLFRDREPLLLNLTDIALGFGFGSGSNIGATSTDSYTKYCNSTMTGTDPSLSVLYRHAVSGDLHLADVERFRSVNYDTDIVRGSNLSFVPKSAKISRTICTEPLLNMLFQKGIAAVMEKRLTEVFNIDLSKQPTVNAAMARIGSHTGDLCTIDLSSASDTIALSLVEEFLPVEAVRWLKLSRSPVTTIPGGAEVKLHMISSMGNGYTFPLQTLLFSALVCAVYRTLDIPVDMGFRGAETRNFSVFGDDIICDKRAFSTLVVCLELLGFSVNAQKSFSEGFFRESCGHDYLHGYNIRGVYITRLASAADFYSAINRLNRWSAYHGVLLPRSVGYLRSLVRFNAVPFHEDDAAGIKVPLRSFVPHKVNSNGSVIYHALIQRPRVVRFPTAEQFDQDPETCTQKVRRFLPDFRYNAAGVTVALLAGWLRKGKIGLRIKRPNTLLKERVCPGWDSSIPAYVETRIFRSHWNVATEVNLGL